jgi:outer membrane protein TolC
MFSPFTAPRRAPKLFRSPRSIVLSLLLGALAASQLAAAEPPLTLDRARHLAIERSRQLAADDAAVAASRDMAVAARQLPDPVLKLGVDNLPINRAERFSLTSDFMTMRRVGLMQEFTRADKRRLRARQFEGEAEKSLAERDVTAAAIERDTALAWLDRYYAEAMAAAISEQGVQARLEVQAAEGAYRGGRGSRADLFAARSALAMFADRESEFQRLIRVATIRLARWVGDAAEQPLAGKPATDTIRLDPATLDQQLAHHPQIAVLAKQEQIAGSAAQLAQANRQADWSVEVAYQQRGPAYSNMVSVGLSVPLQWDRKNRQDRELAARLAQVEQARAERDEMLREHLADTRAMISEWQNGRERSGRYQRELIPLAQGRTAATIAAYRGGKANLPDVLAARKNEIEVRLQALQLEAGAARTWAQLNFLFPERSLAAGSTMMMNRGSREQ